MTEQNNTDTPFSYKYNEDEGIVSIYANDKFVTDLQDENGDPEGCFHWFCEVYSKTNLALGFPLSADDVKKAKTEAITNFIDTMVGALESGFVDKNNPRLAEIYHFATWHIKDNYQQEIPSLTEKWGDDVAAECSGTQK